MENALHFDIVITWLMTILTLGILLYIVYITVMLVGRISDGPFMGFIDYIKQKTGMSDAVAGETIQATGTSAPEIMTNIAVLYIFPLLGGAVISPTIGLSTIVGSAIFQITVVIGYPMLYAKGPVQLQAWPVIRSSLVYIGSVILLVFFMYTGSMFTWWELAILFAYHITYVYYIVKHGGVHHNEAIEETEKEEQNDIRMRSANILPGPNSKIGLWGFGLVILVIGILCYIMVASTERIGAIVQLSTNLLALTVLAAGSSAPEIFTNLFLVKRKRTQQAIANAVGSNTMDICVSFAGVAIPAAIIMGGIPIEQEIIVQMGFSSLLLFAYLFIFLGMLWYSNWKITRTHAYVLNAMFVLFVIGNFIIDITS